MAIGTSPRTHVVLEVFANVLRGSFLVVAVDHGDNTFEVRVVGVSAPVASIIDESNLLAVVAA